MMDEEIRAMHAITRRLKALSPEALGSVASLVVAAANAEAFSLEYMQEATKITALAARIEDRRVRERVASWLYDKCVDLGTIAPPLPEQVAAAEKGNGAA